MVLLLGTGRRSARDRRGERPTRLGAAFRKHASFDFHVNSYAVRARRHGDFGAQAAHGTIGPLLRFAARHTNRSQANVRVPRNGARQVFHRIAAAFWTNGEHDVARPEIRAIVPVSARRSF